MGRACEGGKETKYAPRAEVVGFLYPGHGLHLHPDHAAAHYEDALFLRQATRLSEHQCAVGAAS